MCITEKFQRDYTVVWTKHTYIQTNQKQQYLIHPYIHVGTKHTYIQTNQEQQYLMHPYIHAMSPREVTTGVHHLGGGGGR